MIAVFSRVASGGLGIIGCIALIVYCPHYLLVIAYWGLVGFAVIAFYFVIVIGSLVYSYSGKYWLVPVLASGFFIPLLFCLGPN